MFTSEEVAKKLGIGVQTLERWAKEGRIEYELIDNEFRYSEEAVGSFIHSTGIQLVEPEMNIREFIAAKDIQSIRNNHIKEKELLSEEEIKAMFREQ